METTPQERFLLRHAAALERIRADFLTAYELHGHSVAKACEAIDVTRHVFRMARRYDPTVQALYETALETYDSRLADELRDIGLGIKASDRTAVTALIALRNHHYMTHQHSGLADELPPEIRRLVIPRPMATATRAAGDPAPEAGGAARAAGAAEKTTSTATSCQRDPGEGP